MQVDGDEFALLGDPLELGVEESDLFDIAGTLLSSGIVQLFNKLFVFFIPSLTQV